MPINILIVLEDGASFGPSNAGNVDDEYFTYSELVRTLQDDGDFTVTKAHRSNDPLYPKSTFVGHDLRFVPDYENFSLDPKWHDLSVYDEIWFFGNTTGDEKGEVDPKYALTPAEVNAVFGFMQSGGGVFATGDHWDMGVNLCGLIPRVRSMRRWFYGDPGNRMDTSTYDNEGVYLGPGKGLSAPSASGPYRHDTLQPDIHGEFPFDAQSDAIPQPLQLVYSYGGDHPQWRMPHPILCSAEGDIDTFPDHMHEGEVMEPLQEDWGNVISYNGGDVPEYPFANGTTVVNGVTVPLTRPQIIAFGKVLAGHATLVPEYEKKAHHGSTDATYVDEFGTVCVYDGVPEGVGRIVTDSTFHHFADINLTGDPVAHMEKLLGFLELTADLRLVDGPVLRKMRAYYRNIAYWLARPAAQADALHRTIAFVAAGRPFNETMPPGSHVPDIGLMTVGTDAVASLLRYQTTCRTLAVIGNYLSHREYNVRWPVFKDMPWLLPSPDPWAWRSRGGDPYRGVVAPVEVLQALLGGAVAELRGRGMDAVRRRRHPEALPELARHIEAGFQRGAQALAQHLERRATANVEAAAAVRGDRDDTVVRERVTVPTRSDCP